MNKLQPAGLPSASVEVEQGSERSGKYCNGLWPNAGAIFSLLEAHPWDRTLKRNTLDTSSFSFFFLIDYYYLLFLLCL